MLFSFGEGGFSLRGPDKGGRGGGEPGEWCRSSAVVSYEPAVEVSKPQEPLKLFSGGKSGTLNDSPYLLRVRPLLPTLKEESQEPDEVDMKFTSQLWQTGGPPAVSEGPDGCEGCAQQGFGRRSVCCPGIERQNGAGIPENVIDQGLEHC